MPSGAGHVLVRDLDAEVAARDHHGVGQPDDVVDLLQRRRLLDLGDIAGAVADERARLDESSGRCTKDSATQSTPSSSPKARSARSFSVSGERSRTVPGRLTPLRLEITPPTDDPRLDVVPAEAVDAHPDPAVVDQELLARRDGREDLGMRQRDRVLVARRARSSTKRTVSPLSSSSRPSRNGADADLRTLQILQDADRPADLPLQGPDRGMDPGVVVLRAVAEVQPEHVDAGQEQGLQRLRSGAGRSDGGDDLGVTVPSHR